MECVLRGELMNGHCTPQLLLIYLGLNVGSLIPLGVGERGGVCHYTKFNLAALVAMT